MGNCFIYDLKGELRLRDGTLFGTLLLTPFDFSGVTPKPPPNDTVAGKKR